MQDLSRTIGYCRVSTPRQMEEGHGLERYIHQLRSYGLTDEQIFWDVESGAKDSRKGYNHVLDEICAGRVDELIIPCFDRFTRSSLHWEKALETFMQHRVKVRFLDGGGLDLSNPDGRFTSRILAAFAAQVREKNIYNSLQGWKFLRMNAKAIKPPFGYRVECDRFVFDHSLYKDTGKTRYEIARELIERFKETGNLAVVVRSMARLYGAVVRPDFPRSHNNFSKWLKHPVMRGHTRYMVGGTEEIITNTHEQKLIDDDEWQEIKHLLLVGGKLKKSRRLIVNPLAGLMICAICGGKIRISCSKGKYAYLNCSNAYEGKCTRRSSYGLQLCDVEAAVINCLCSKAVEIAAIGVEQEVQQESLEILAIRKEIERLEMMNDPDLSDAIALKKNKLAARLLQEKELTDETTVLRDKLSAFAAVPDFWNQATLEERHTLYHELVKSVVVDKGNLIITLQI